ncbi:MAG: ATP-binding cassette domain-containing protein [Acidimicrobiales bacterium]
MTALIEVAELTKRFRVGRLGRRVERVAVDGVSFSVEPGTTFGLVGESGSGKTTVARVLCRFVRPDGGQVLVDGIDVATIAGAALTRFRRRVQLVFQDPFASLDPRWKVGALVAEGMRIHGHVPPPQRRDKVLELLDRCGLAADHADRFPHEFSGGQRQRISIARALAVEPDILVLDEPVSALDVSIRAQILNLLTDLQADLGLTHVLIAHDLAVVERCCHQIAVMQQGRIVEHGPADQLFRAPAHPYTRSLLEAIPVPDPARRRARAPGGAIP